MNNVIVKIEEIVLRHVVMRLVEPFVTSFGITNDRSCVIVEMKTADITGYGECVAKSYPGYSYETTGTAWHILSDFLVPAVLGKDLTDIETFVKNYSHIKGHPMAKASLEMAAWDILGKSQNKSLSELFGGMKKSVEVGVSVGIQLSSEALVERVVRYIDDGYRRIKIKIKPGRDFLDLKAIRNTFPEILLQADANSAYRLSDSEVFLSMDELNLLLIEQPLAEDDIYEHSFLQKQIKTSICLDESILSVSHAKAALDLGSCRIINIKAPRVGGLLEAVKIHDECYKRDVPVWSGGMLETNIGRASNLALASLAGFILPSDISASSRYYEEDIAWPNFVLNRDSTINVPSEPGLGIEINHKNLDSFTVKKEVFRSNR
jgi:O-succinylbenzoate synthase